MSATLYYDGQDRRWGGIGWPFMNPAELFQRYQELQQYVAWTAEDARWVRRVAGIAEPQLPPLIDDFYREIARHEATRKVITGGQAQIERLKGTLLKWLRELLTGPYDSAYVERRWQVGWRHVEIGLDQVFTNAALARLRGGLLRIVTERWSGTQQELPLALAALNKLLDLDLAIIEDAYQTEYLSRTRSAVRQQSEAAFRTLVEAAPSLILIIRPDESILYFSPYAERLTGHRHENLIGSPCAALFGDNVAARDLFRERIQQVLQGQAPRSFESPIAGKEGLRRWVLWTAQRLPDYHQGPAILVIGQDITDVKEARDRALQAERLAAIGQMVTGLAHESGNALARSQACLEMLALEVEGNAEALDLIQRIQKAQDHLRLLYEEVRGYAAPLKLAREDWDVSAVWRQAWANLNISRKGRQASLVEHIDGLQLECRVDPFRLEQVFRNLLENALAACKDPVVIQVSGSDAVLDGQPALAIKVRDNGPGLSAEQRQRIFEPFFTTKTKGTGLGMAIARRIIEAHGGQIAVGDSAGTGAEIVLTLPREMR